MATGISEQGLGRFRKWYGQYRATHGTPPPRTMVTDYLQGEIEAEMARSDRARSLGLEERRLTLSEKQGKESLALQEKLGMGQLDLNRQNLALKREEIDANAGAAKVSGIGTLALSSGLLAKELGVGKLLFPAGEVAGTGAAIPATSATGTALPATAGASTAITEAGAGAGLAEAGASTAVTEAGATAGLAEAGGSLTIGGAGGVAGGAMLGSMIGKNIGGNPGLGGFLGGMAGGAAMGSIIPGIGTAAGAIIGAVVGLTSSKCIIISSCTSRESFEVQVARAYRDEFLDFDQLIGYYFLSSYVVPKLDKHHWLKRILKRELVDRLVKYGLSRLLHGRCSIWSFLVSKAFLGGIKLIGFMLFLSSKLEVQHG